MDHCEWGATNGFGDCGGPIERCLGLIDDGYNDRTRWIRLCDVHKDAVAMQGIPDWLVYEMDGPYY